VCVCVCVCVRALGTGFSHDTLALKEILLGEGPSFVDNPLWSGFLKVTAHTQDFRGYRQGSETKSLLLDVIREAVVGGECSLPRFSPTPRELPMVFPPTSQSEI
jgi:hypothetical protein